MPKKYVYSFAYDVAGDGYTTIGNFLESDVCLHVLPGEDGYDECYFTLKALCSQQIEREFPGVKVRAADIEGVTEPDGEFYSLPDHIQMK